MKKTDKIYIAGHTGLVGLALLNKLKEKGYENLIFRSKKDLDLRDEKKVRDFFAKEKPNYVFLAAGKSGGIFANTRYPAELIRENIQIEGNVIHQAYQAKVKKLLYIGCTCLYPRLSPQPMKEDYLLKGPFEPTSEAFSVAKLAGLKMCEVYNQQYKTNFICVIAENLFGPHDKFNLEWGHVVPALIEKFHRAKMQKSDKVIIWGSGKPVRSFMYIEDAAEAMIFLMRNYRSTAVLNIGADLRVSIRELAELIKDVVGFKGRIVFDRTKPDGMLFKTLDIRHFLRLGWKPQFSLKEGIIRTYQWYVNYLCR